MLVIPESDVMCKVMRSDGEAHASDSGFPAKSFRPVRAHAPLYASGPCAARQVRIARVRLSSLVNAYQVLPYIWEADFTRQNFASKVT